METLFRSILHKESGTSARAPADKRILAALAGGGVAVDGHLRLSGLGQESPLTSDGPAWPCLLGGRNLLSSRLAEEDAPAGQVILTVICGIEYSSICGRNWVRVGAGCHGTVDPGSTLRCWKN